MIVSYNYEEKDHCWYDDKPIIALPLNSDILEISVENTNLPDTPTPHKKEIEAI